ncbi:MAG: glutamine--fructose-6-phosphate transaminase (isomerizing) [bacterium]
MCGIVGYVGKRDCSSILLNGLRRLEYRGYDSAGIAILTDTGLQLSRAEGKLANLERAFYAEPFAGSTGLGHTRWATHGGPTEQNAHPHRAGRIVIAHNGIIENYLALKEELSKSGREFTSATDTEVVAHLIDQVLPTAKSLHDAVTTALARIHGSYALVVMDVEDPDQIIVARNASPMVLGVGNDESFAASDVPAVLEHTRQFIFLNDGETAILRREGIALFDAQGGAIVREPRHIPWDPISAEKQGYKHFMLKEIHEQPARIVDTLRGRVNIERGDVDLSEVDIDEAWLASAHKVTLIACGTSYYAALVGKYLLESIARIPVEVDLASEFRYRNPVVNEHTLCVAISQSGETADTLAAMREAQSAGARAMAICNVIESTIARESDGVLYTHAGPEIGVASTKAFTTQLAALGMLAVWLGRRRHTLTPDAAREILESLRSVPTAMESLLGDMTVYEDIAKEFSGAHSFLYLGRGVVYPIALEGALKLKEISYIHAEGYAAGEMKHGPIALIDEDMPVVVLAPKNNVYEKTASNVEEVRARDGKVIAVVTKGDTDMARHADVVIEVPDVHEYVQPLICSVVVQLIAYAVADFKGTDVDQPRNLAKSVTVE